MDDDVLYFEAYSLYKAIQHLRTAQQALKEGDDAERIDNRIELAISRLALTRLMLLRFIIENNPDEDLDVMVNPLCG